MRRRRIAIGVVAVAVAKSETRSSGALPVALAWLGHEVLPPMATKSGQSGHVSRTQEVKAAENGTGAMRFIRIGRRRLPEMPW